MERSRILEGLIGRRVQVWSRTGNTDCRDEGQVIDADPVAIVIAAPSGALVFPLTNVRLIKVVD